MAVHATTTTHAVLTSHHRCKASRGDLALNGHQTEDDDTSEAPCWAFGYCGTFILEQVSDSRATNVLIITNTHTASHFTQDLANSVTKHVLASVGLLALNPRLTYSLLLLR
jgi:hypothetical protein